MSHIPSRIFAVVKKINRPVMSTMVVRAGLATTAGSNFNLAAARGIKAPIMVDVKT